jgi:predicted glutamine amidotransferase
MCRILAYLGEPLPAQHLLLDRDNGPVRQSYNPLMMHTFLNLAGFGMNAWDPTSLRPEDPFSYRATTLPSFDRDLRFIASKLAPTSLVAQVRGVTYSGEAVVTETNLHPFQFTGTRVVLAHNGHLRQFARMRYSLVEPVRPELAPCIQGTTDFEWIYALILSQLDDPYRGPRARRCDRERAPHPTQCPRRARHRHPLTGQALSQHRPDAGRDPPSRSTTAGYPPDDEMLETDLPFVSSGTRSGASTPSAAATGG